MPVRAAGTNSGKTLHGLDAIHQKQGTPAVREDAGDIVPTEPTRKVNKGEGIVGTEGIAPETEEYEADDFEKDDEAVDSDEPVQAHIEVTLPNNLSMPDSKGGQTEFTEQAP